MKLLEIDVGNSRLKWRLGDGESLSEGFLPTTEAIELGSLLEEVAKVDAIAVASVGSQESKRHLALALKHIYGVDAWFAESTNACAGIRNSYQEPERLGVDRWLAMIAAYDRYKQSVCVIDAGSCLTVDWVTAEGQHQGGYIVPGWQMTQRSLLSETGRVRFSPAQDKVSAVSPGVSTAEAVEHGALLQYQSFLQGAIQEILRLGGQMPKIVVAGGDAPLVLSALEQVVCEYPDMVLDGLRLAYIAQGKAKK